MLTGFTLFGGAADDDEFPEHTGNADLTALAYDVLQFIKDNDFAALSQAAHPEFGVVFSPSATINLAANKRFNTAQIAAMGTDSNVYIWGIHDGSGEPIEMTPVEYFNEFIPAGSFICAPYIGVNRIARSGNALENITDVFPDIKFIDFHLPGGEREAAEEPDWSSLRFGFEIFEGSFRLTVIIYSKWTV